MYVINKKPVKISKKLSNHLLVQGLEGKEELDDCLYIALNFIKNKKMLRESDILRRKEE